MSKLNKAVKKILYITIFFFLTATISNVTFAEDEKLQQVPYSDVYMKWLNLPEEERKNAIEPPKYIIDIPEDYGKISNLASKLKIASKYDLRNEINIKLKDQMQTGSCWAFSTTTTLETYMSKVKNKNVEYSPRHIEYATSRTFLDGTNKYPFNREVNEGGNPNTSFTYLTDGLGPVLEKDMPFQNSTTKIRLSEIDKPVAASVKEFIEFPNILKEISGGTIKYTNGLVGNDAKNYSYSEVEGVRNKIKEHITKYGSVTSAMALYRDFLANDGKSFNCNNTSYVSNHAISIIGWDDNYPVSNFKSNCRPSQPGAWLVQNSHGENNSYIYISYEDVWIEAQVYGVIEIDDMNYDKIYQYDYLGETIELYTMYGSEAYTLNVFEKGDKTEFLNEISFYTVPGEEYEVYVNQHDGTTDMNKFVKIKSVQETDSSYVTVKLEHQIQLTGTKFAVMIKYINKKENVKISVETKMNEFEPYIYCSSNAGESYYYTRDQGFIDMKKINSLQDANACIKAFTSFSGENVATNITSDKYKISDENKIIYEILPDTDIGELKNNINCNKNYNILDKQKNNITDTSTTISTGHSLITESYETYVLIVKGDLNGDGKLTGTDILKAKRYWAEIENLLEYEFIACDINEDNDITGTDILNMLKYYCDKITW